MLFQRRMANNSAPANYLYMNATDLQGHLLIAERDKTYERIIFLGSSAVAGSNIPRASTTSDYLNRRLSPPYKSYNLATLQASLLESLVYLEMAIAIRPALVVLGIEPGAFPRFSSSPVLWRNGAFIKKLMGEEMAKAIENERIMKLDSLIFETQNRPPDYYLSYLELIEGLKNSFFGPVFNVNLYGQKGQSLSHVLQTDNPLINLLKKLSEHMKERKIKLVVYLEPIFRPEVTYGPGFENYLRQVKKILNDQEIPFFDYTNLVPPVHDYFSDFIHMTPAGNQLVANTLAKDLLPYLRGGGE